MLDLWWEVRKWYATVKGSALDDLWFGDLNDLVKTVALLLLCFKHILKLYTLALL